MTNSARRQRPKRQDGCASQAETRDNDLGTRLSQLLFHYNEAPGEAHLSCSASDDGAAETTARVQPSSDSLSSLRYLSTRFAIFLGIRRFGVFACTYACVHSRGRFARDALRRPAHFVLSLPKRVPRRATAWDVNLVSLSQLERILPPPLGLIRCSTVGSPVRVVA